MTKRKQKHCSYIQLYELLSKQQEVLDETHEMMATAAVKRAWLNANQHHHQQLVHSSNAGYDTDLRPYWQQQQQPQWPEPHYRSVTSNIPVATASYRHHSPSPSVEVCEQGHNALKVRTADCGPHLVSLGSGRLSTNITLIHLPEGNSLIY